MPLTTKSELIAELESLRKLADEQSHHYKSARKLLYEGLSRVYLLWSDASKVEGMLESLYKEHGIQYKREILADVNFSPLLRYLWDMDGTINSNTIDQWNRALNKLHTHFLGNREFYRTATLVKLISFFTTNGGISNLAAYSSTFDEGGSKPRKRKLDTNLEKMRLAKHIEKGREYFAKGPPSIASFQSKGSLPTADGDLAVGIIRRSRRGYDLVGVVDDKDVIESVVIHAYKRDTSATPFPLRFILEVLKTQCPPHYIRSLNRSLNDQSKTRDDKGRTLPRLRRLLFMPKEGIFLLSAARGSCSAVTIAYPKAKVIEASEDIFLGQNDRSFLEEEVIFAGDDNLISTDCEHEIAQVSDQAASHKMFLTHSVTRKSRFVRFYPLSIYKSTEAIPQSILRKGITIAKHFSVSVDKKWVNELDGKFLSRWISGFGKTIKRKEYAVQRVSFGKTGVIFQFIQRGNGYDDQVSIPFSSVKMTKPIALEVLSKDLIPVLNFIAHADLLGNVSIEACEGLVRFKFDTSTSSYLIAVPTCSHAGKRNEALFQSYGGCNEKLE